MSNELSTLEHDLEETRERLAATIDQLLYRASPKTIARREADQAKAFFVDPRTGEPRTGNILKVAGGVAGAVTVVAVLRRVTR